MKSKKKFKAREGSPFSVKDAQKIGEELELIKSKESLNPKNVLKRAKSKKSILHKYFEWDDSVASEKWRIQQARGIVNHVIEVVVVRGEEVEERAFFSVVVKKDESAYVTLSEAITIPSYKQQLLGEMETTLENLLRLIKLFSSMK